MSEPVMKISCGEQSLEAVFDTAGGMSVMNQRLFPLLEKDFREGSPIEVEDATGNNQTIPVYIVTGWL